MSWGFWPGYPASNVSGAHVDGYVERRQRVRPPRLPLGRSPSRGYKRSVELSDLRGDERLALVALLKVAVVADGSVSDEEVEEIGEVVDAFGEREYRELVDEVSRRFQSQDDLKTFLETIERPEARELIYAFFLEEAAAEALRGRESEMVAWLGDTWKIEIEIDDSEAR
jgi:uncharacterized tellurite resistance protein B-like protein